MKLKKLLKIIPNDAWFIITDPNHTAYGPKQITYLLNKKVLKVEPKYNTNNPRVLLSIEVEE